MRTKKLVTKKIILATILSCLVMWLLAGLWHEVIMASFYEGESQATHEGTGIILIAYLILGLLMAYIYPMRYKGKQLWAGGLRFGLIIGLLWDFHMNWP